MGPDIVRKPPACNRSRIDRERHILIGWGVKLLAPALFVEFGLLLVPGQPEKLGHAAALVFKIGDYVFVTSFEPGKAFPLSDREPDIHQIGVMFCETFEAEEVHISGVE